MLSDHEEFNLDQADQDVPGSLINLPGTNTQYSTRFGDNDGDTLANLQRFSRPPLRSRPAMDFSGQRPSAFRLVPTTNVSGRQSAVGSDYSATVFSQPRSQASGSASHSSLRPEYHFPHPSLKPEHHSSHRDPYFDLDASDIPPNVIASLTITQLYYHPHYREIRQRLDDVSATLSKYVERDLSQPQVQAPPPIYQGASRLAPLVAHC